MGEMQVGPRAVNDGDFSGGRAARTGEALFGMIHPRFYEQAKRGNLYSGHTAVTGVAPGTAIGTTAAFALYNPAGSGFDLVMLEADMSYLSGTLGIGFVSYVGHTNPAQAAITGTAIPVVNGKVSGAAGVGKPLTTATVPASGSPFRLFANLPPILASSVVTPWRSPTRSTAQSSFRRVAACRFRRPRRPARRRWSSSACCGRKCRSNDRPETRRIARAVYLAGPGRPSARTRAMRRE